MVIEKAMLAALDRKGFDEFQDPALQPQMIEPARIWIARWRDLLAEDPVATAGPLASLLADAYQLGQESKP